MNLAPDFVQQYFDNSGNPLASGTISSFIAGTATPQATYTDSSGGTPNTNPVVLDSSGRAAIWLDPTLSYKLVIKDSLGNTIKTVDTIAGSAASGIPQWNANTTYSQGSIVADGSGQGILYVSLTNGNLNNALTSVANWRSFEGSILTKTTNYSIAVTDDEVRSNTTSGNLTHTLPPCSTTPVGRLATVKDIGDGATFGTTVKGSGSDNVDGNNTWPVTLKFPDSATFRNNGTSWDVVSGIVSPAPTVQAFLSTGTQTGWLFTCSAANATVGATYTNNGNTFTVLNTIAASTTLACSGTGATSGVTLTKTAGTGDPTITISTKIALATYTTPTSPRKPIYIRYRMVGGGGGGGGSGTAGLGTGGTGGQTYFAASIANGGPGGSGETPGGTSSAVFVTGTQLAALNSGIGGGGGNTSGITSTQIQGGSGASSPFGGGGGGGIGNAGGGLGQGGQANTGGGGGGGGGPSASGSASGAGGSAGSYIEGIISSPAATYPYVVGAGGTAGVAGTSGNLGGAGGTGLIIIEEYYR